MKFKSKKGVIEAQFNWIFILIVGGIILLFFISMVKNSSESHEITLSSDLLNNLDSIAKGSAISIGTVYDIDMPPKHSLDNKCNLDEKILTFYKSGLEGIDMKYNVLFAPNIISGSKLYTYSLYWQAPFIVTPFLYMTSDKVLFFIIDNVTQFQKEVDFLYKEIPLNDESDKFDEDGNKVSVLKYKADINFVKEILKLENDYYSNINIIYFGEIPDINTFFDEVNRKSKAKISIYEIKDPGDSKFESAFDVNYHEITNGNFESKGTVGVLGLASFMGLLFSEDIESYRCNMNKSIFKYSILLDIYQNKSGMLEEYVEKYPQIYDPDCLQFYVPSEYSSIKSQVDDYLDTSSKSMSELFESIESSIRLLKQNNINLGDISCPIPY